MEMGARAYDFLLSEAAGTRSRAVVTVATGEKLEAGAVLGRVNKTLAAAAVPTNEGTGTGVMSGLTFGPDVLVGDYVVELIETGSTAAFMVTAADGRALPDGAVGTPYVTNHVSFTIADGGTMTDGDVYTISVVEDQAPVLIGTGTGAVSGLSLGPAAQHGTYTVTLTATGSTAAFDVIAPDGGKIASGKVATPYASDHINFTLANGGTMTAGDTFSVIVAGSSSDVVKAWTPGASDGTGMAYGVLTAAADATVQPQGATAIVRDAEVERHSLVMPGVSAAEAQAAIRQLAQAGVISRY
jgi:hypothetical protein